LEHPFFTLKASQFDDKERLLELSEDRAIDLDANICQEARLNVSHPAKRLIHEISWFPGTEINVIQEYLAYFDLNISKVIPIFHKTFTSEHLNNLSKANFLTSYLFFIFSNKPKLYKKIGIDLIKKTIMIISDCFESIDNNELQNTINTDREISKFPKISDCGAVAAAINEHRLNHRTIIKEILNDLGTIELVNTITDIASSAVTERYKVMPLFLSEFIDAYETEAQSFFELEKANVSHIIKEIKTIHSQNGSNRILHYLSDQLISICKNWYHVAEPIIISTSSRGIIHNETNNLFKLVRDFCLKLSNDYHKLDLSLKITTALHYIFNKIDNIKLQTTKDMSRLEELFIVDRSILVQQALNSSDNKLLLLDYKIKRGWDISDDLTINKNGITYGRSHFQFDEIIAIRLEPPLTVISTQDEAMKIEIMNPQILKDVFLRLHPFVIFPLISEHIINLQHGKSYSFGNLTIHDEGIIVSDNPSLSHNENSEYTWDQIRIGKNDKDYIFISKITHHSLGSLSINKVQNMIIFQVLIEQALNKNFKRLSDFTRQLSE
jgi:hypothetical protein